MMRCKDFLKKLINDGRIIKRRSDLLDTVAGSLYDDCNKHLFPAVKISL